MEMLGDNALVKTNIFKLSRFKCYGVHFYSVYKVFIREDFILFIKSFRKW